MDHSACINIRSKLEVHNSALTGPAQHISLLYYLQKKFGKHFPPNFDLSEQTSYNVRRNIAGEQCKKIDLSLMQVVSGLSNGVRECHYPLNRLHFIADRNFQVREFWHFKYRTALVWLNLTRYKMEIFYALQHLPILMAANVPMDAIMQIVCVAGIILHRTKPNGQYSNSKYRTVKGMQSMPTFKSATAKLAIRQPVTKIKDNMAEYEINKA